MKNCRYHEGPPIRIGLENQKLWRPPPTGSEPCGGGFFSLIAQLALAIKALTSSPPVEHAILVRPIARSTILPQHVEEGDDLSRCAGVPLTRYRQLIDRLLTARECPLIWWIQT